MRNYFYILFLFVGFTSCDDGDIIINNFDFEDATLTSCKKTGKAKVLYIINNDDIFETISLQATNTAFSEEADVLTTNITSEIRFDISTSNKLIYRTYDGSVPTTGYFCKDIPPSNPKVIEEFISVGGTVVINTIAEFNTTDKDGDGVPDAEELDEDTDEDGIMNVDDNDDDGDNVLTSTEIANFNEDAVNEDGYRDTDTDGTPNYLDDDDDGDGILTRNEVTAGDQSPTDPANFTNGLAFYLDVNVANGFEGVTYVLENSINVTYRSSITIQNLQLQNQNGSGEVISFETYDLGDFVSRSTPLIISPTSTETEN